MVTTQSVTAQPRRPCRSADRTPSSVAVTNAGGSLPGSMPDENSMPCPTACGLDPQPDPGQVGVVVRPIRSTAAPVPRTRSMQTTEVPEKRARTPYLSSSRAASTSFWTSPCRLTAASPSISSRCRSISGSSSASSVRPANSAVRWVGSSGSTRARRVAGGEAVGTPLGRSPEGVTDPGEGPAHDGDLAGLRGGPDRQSARPAHRDFGDPLRSGRRGRLGPAPGSRRTTS